ncbi:protease inhibitors-like [Photinus pyralis]|uniref:protease inhibitors-like n=1 Tax=Photinus pyralis TaxID=7054 RepID=UPI00126753D0|nr:protease inhibitors-like [Photinus pyralis]XP_031357225.1 protease inhibitors-like [Photinus pyralis]
MIFARRLAPLFTTIILVSSKLFTKMRCLKFVVLFVVFLGVESKFKCEQGVYYLENDCNTCFCDPYGDLGCSSYPCFSREFEQLLNCKDGTVTKRGCNICECVGGRGTICTNKTCRK